MGHSFWSKTAFGACFNENILFHTLEYPSCSSIMDFPSKPVFAKRDLPKLGRIETRKIKIEVSKFISRANLSLFASDLRRSSTVWMLFVDFGGRKIEGGAPD
ncbi:hypothetical protein AAC387_Pa03g3645 [Persea americana]